MVETLILVRHGEVEGARPGSLLGRNDPSLSEAGRRQVAAARDALASVSFDCFLCSPLLRARESAEIIGAGRMSAEVDIDLREMDFGEWEGLTYAEVERRDAEGARAWAEFAPGFAFPGGERLEDFSARIARLADALSRREARTVVAVAHGGVIRALVCCVLGLPLRDYLLFDITPASVTTLRVWGERGVLAGLWSPGLPPLGPAAPGPAASHTTTSAVVT